MGSETNLDQLRRFAIERRNHLGLRQQDVAELAGISASWVSTLEAGRLKSSPRHDTLVGLSRGLTACGELQGDLVNFLSLVLEGVFSDEVVLQVAKGQRTALSAMVQATNEVAVLPTDQQEVSEQKHRHKRLERVLSLVKVDLTGRDYVIAADLLRHLYEVDSRSYS